MSTETNKAIVERFDAILNDRDLDRLDELCSPDMVNHSLAPGRPPGLDGTRQWLTTVGPNFESFRWRTLSVVGEQDLVVQFGVREGQWPGEPSAASRSLPGTTSATLPSCTGSPVIA